MRAVSLLHFAVPALAGVTIDDQIPLGNGVNSVSGYEIARKALRDNADLDLDPDLQQIVKEMWDQEWIQDPAGFLARLQPDQPAPHSEPVHRDFHRKDGTQKTVRHTSFPNYQLRITDPGEALGLDSVQQHSGYIDVLDSDKHYFFWMFESRNDPSNDPVVLWLNGGPGASSLVGEFFELGSKLMLPNGTLQENAYSWNSNANVIFLDQPVNVGYSYGSERVSDSATAGEEVYAFLEILFHGLPQYANLPFHIAGESYAGKYIPAIGEAILNHPERTFNLSSVLMGNPMTDPANQAFSRVAMMCGDGGYPRLYPEELCEALWAMVPPCEALYQACYASEKSTLICDGAQYYCSLLDYPFMETGRNPYNIDEIVDEDEGLYPALYKVQEFLRKPSVIQAVGSDVHDYALASPEVSDDFGFTNDVVRGGAPYIVDMLNAGVDVLVYVGEYDYVCGWPGVYRVLERLPFKQHSEFNAKHAHTWYMDDHPAGEFKSAGHLTWLKVYEVGHMVPYDNGKVALSMLNQWLEERSFA